MDQIGRQLMTPPVKGGSAHGRIAVKDLTVRFGSDHAQVSVLEGLSFDVKAGEFLCLLGTSGCGKSTILNVLAGFVEPTSGVLLLDGSPIAGPGPDRAMVFQRHALFPWKTVVGNIEFGLRMLGRPQNEIRDRAAELIRLVGLSGFEKRYPAELSGGMEQRVGLARTLAVDPVVLLMDEPFGSLDAQTRIMMQELLLRIWDEAEKTVVFVTHDVDEAVLLADRIVILTARPGSVRAEIPVNLPRPRAYDVAMQPEFIAIKQKALALIREESAKAIQTGVDVMKGVEPHV